VDELVRTAETLAIKAGLEGLIAYRQGSALAMPFASRSFDGAYMLHMDMNIQDKAALFAEALRVLNPGDVFGIYDVLSEGPRANCPSPCLGLGARSQILSRASKPVEDCWRTPVSGSKRRTTGANSPWGSCCSCGPTRNRQSAHSSSA
jgi:ubiquinone/menaquinone biosynthesis C-methylase UbiE